MVYVEYKVLEAKNPAPAEQLEKDFGKDGWILQVIIPWNGGLLYYFVRYPIDFIEKN